MKTKSLIQTLLLIPLCYSCISGGTHGEIGSYEFKTKKDSVDKWVHQVISENDQIMRDTSDSWSLIDGDTIWDTYYNDSINYLTIIVGNAQNLPYRYIFRYAGDSTDWSKDSISTIFIAYGFNNLNQGGSDGQGNVSDKLGKELNNVFYNNFISLIEDKSGGKSKKE